ncbi:MAG: threonyl-tRNA synthetase editing domain-containing protein, partial [Desulfurococcales archaeon]|nr:threonyl-tRNA synthetase editing domain-containing protein [Desulfurococcales archaeon]
MRLLYLHVSEAWYRAVRPALREPPDPPGESSVSEALLAFFTVEEGDDESVVANAARDIASHARSLKVDT